MAKRQPTKRARDSKAASPAPPASVQRDPRETGASGTENFGGTIVGEEYNPQLLAPAGYRIYDEMRMSDPDVQASLEILKTPIMSANWTVQAPENATPQEQEVADFCQSALFERGAMSDTWKYFLEHALMSLDYGVMPFEKVFTLGEDGRVRLRRLAPRLPKTIQKWLIDEKDGTGKLTAVEQLTLKDGKFANIPIPATSMAIFVRRREGDNWWGRSVLRTAYKPWYYKCQAEKAEAVRIYRYGVGVPVASRDKDYGPKAGELEEVEQIAKGIVSHERSYIVTNTNWSWEILVPQGGGGDVAGTRDAIDRHGKSIMRNVLAEFMAGGASDGLNSGRTRTLANVFASQLYSTAEDIIGVLDLDVLRPLCNFNFLMEAQKLRYPSIVANDVTDVDVKQLADILGRLSALKVVTADDDLEAFVRKLLGLPAMMEASKGKSRERVVVPPGAPTPSNPDNGGGKDPATDPEEKPEGDKGDRVDEEEQLELARALQASRPALGATKRERVYTLEGRNYCRQPTDFETLVFSLSRVPDQLDGATESLAASLAAIRQKQLTKLAQQIAKKDARKTTGEFTDLRPSQFSVSFKPDVERALKSAMQVTANFGATEVRLEIDRQARARADELGITASRPMPPVALYPLKHFVLAGVGANKTIAKSALTTSAKVATEAETDAWFNRILEAATRIRRGGLQGDELAAAIEAAMQPELETGLKALAKGELNEAFSIGRATEATALSDEIGTVEYSCLLDANSCDNCAAEDGKTFEFESKEYFRTLPPFKECDGNKGRPDACRCVHLYHLK